MSAIPNYKDIVDLLKKGATLEAQEKILELREGALGLQEENLRLRSQLSELRGEMKVSKALRFDGNLYWLENEGSETDGPFCPVCRDKDNKLVRLHDGRKRNVKTRWVCLICNSVFLDSK